MNKDNNVLQELFDIVESRKVANPDKSYVAKLFKKGRNKIAQKVGEEAAETIIAALKESKENTVQESADLLFHLVVLWADKGVTPNRVFKELKKRMGQSGLDEKAARKAK